MGRSPEGALKSDQPSGLSYLPGDESMARKHDREVANEAKTISLEPDSELVVFLGRAMSHAEYDIACHNLRNFFDLLRSWQKGDTDEPSEL